MAIVLAVNRPFLYRSSGNRRCELTVGICGVQNFECDHNMENQPVSEKINYRKCAEIVVRAQTLMEILKKKRVFLEDEVLNWLHIWTAASLLDVKCNKAEFCSR